MEDAIRFGTLPPVEIKINGIGAPKIPQCKHVDVCT